MAILDQKPGKARKFDLYTRTNQLVVDGTIFACAFAAAYLIRFDGIPPWPFMKQYLLWLPYLIILRLIVNWKTGIYRFIWKYVSLSDALAITQSLLLVTFLILAPRIAYPPWWVLAVRVRLPVSIIALEFLLSLGGSLGGRALRRTLYERSQRLSAVGPIKAKRVLLYGAGRAGILLLREFANNRGVKVVGFADDDSKKVGTVISGTKVLGGLDSLDRIIREQQVDEVVISIATASRKTVTQILNKCDAVPVSTRIIPTLQEIIEGEVKISQVREVRIEDLLGRSSVEMTEFDEEIGRAYKGKRILVTGAGGSIGSELVRQLLLFNPQSIALLDKDENSTYELEQELVFRYPNALIEPQIADIRHPERLHAVFKEFRPEVVFHAAAHKHVPLMEKHPCEAVLNNVFGTATLLEVCRQHNVSRFVFISSDKAVNPTNVMGATKRVGEMLVQSFATEGTMPAACVRFGNVMGSRGSVLPLFQKQISEGGPITVTHPEIVRFFMTIPEAVQLVLCAGTLGEKGEVFVLDMGNPRKILDLAQDIVELSGLRPGKDIEIVITGMRPGEKLEEELVAPNESVGPTRFEKVSMIALQPLETDKVSDTVAGLLQVARENDREGIYRILYSMGLGFRAPDQLREPPASSVTASG